jgi:hypothetical protein
MYGSTSLLLDVHLGILARRLRVLGIDTRLLQRRTGCIKHASTEGTWGAQVRPFVAIRASGELQSAPPSRGKPDLLWQR